MGHAFCTHAGEPFEVREVGRAMTCRACFRIIRVREQCGFFAQQPERDQHECRECLNDQPLNEHNKWRTDHPQHLGGGTLDE